MGGSGEGDGLEWGGGVSAEGREGRVGEGYGKGGGRSGREGLYSGQEALGNGGEEGKGEGNGW